MAANNRITVSLEDREYQELIRLSKEQDRSLSWIVRQAIVAHLEAGNPLKPQTNRKEGN